MKPLSKNQLITLNILIKEAWSFQERHHATDGMNLTEWRHEQVQKLLGKSGLSACVNADYRKLKSHFEVMAGRGSFNNIILAGTPTRASHPQDTYQNRQTKVKLIFDCLLAHGKAMAAMGREDECITAVYVEAIARAKFKLTQVELHKLTAQQLDQLLYTVRNRITAREGRGDAKKRNKSQRTRRPQITAAPVATTTPPLSEPPAALRRFTPATPCLSN
jgi:hypothetical protein